MTAGPDQRDVELQARWGMLASALRGRDIRVEDAGPGALPWTDGKAIRIDGSAPRQLQLQTVCIQSALLAADSLNPAIARGLLRRASLGRRYLAIEVPRALAALEAVLPPAMQPVIAQSRGGPTPAHPSRSPSDSLAIALSRAAIADPPGIFGTIQPNRLLTGASVEKKPDATVRHRPRQQQQGALIELAEEASQETEEKEDFASSPVGGGGGLGKLLMKLFDSVRQLKGGGSPGADAPTHWIRSGPRSGARGVLSSATASTPEDGFGTARGIRYPEWDVHRRRYRPDWCTVLELDPPASAGPSVRWPSDRGLRKPLLRLGMGLERFHRQQQGDEIDIDAAIEARLEQLAGATVDESLYIESQRHRRDLSVLILLDISGSVSQLGPMGTSVHEQQRIVAAAMLNALHAVGDRVALYALHSQGRSAVHLVPVKRFDERLDSTTMGRLSSLVPGAYSRLGAAIRHGATLLIERGGTPRRLLVVLSDGLAYDHGYEPAYGAADARKALGEARRDGVGCLCLSVGAETEAAALRGVFGSAAFAAIPGPGQLGPLIGPLFRAALRATDIQRRFA